MQNITINQLRDVYNVARNQGKLDAIIALRNMTRNPVLGLGDAKMIVELISDHRAVTGAAPNFEAIEKLLALCVPSGRPLCEEPRLADDSELALMSKFTTALDKLTGRARTRVLSYLCHRYDC